MWTDIKQKYQSKERASNIAESSHTKSVKNPRMSLSKVSRSSHEYLSEAQNLAQTI